MYILETTRARYHPRTAHDIGVNASSANGTRDTFIAASINESVFYANRDNEDIHRIRMGLRNGLEYHHPIYRMILIWLKNPMFAKCLPLNLGIIDLSTTSNCALPSARCVISLHQMALKNLFSPIN